MTSTLVELNPQRLVKRAKRAPTHALAILRRAPRRGVRTTERESLFSKLSENANRSAELNGSAKRTPGFCPRSALWRSQMGSLAFPWAAVIQSLRSHSSAKAREGFGLLIARRQKRCRDRPRDVEIRVDVAQTALGCCVVRGAHLVLNIREITEHAKPVRESNRNEQLLALLIIELDGEPAAERGRIGPNIYSHVPNSPASNAHQLGLPWGRLIVKPTERASY